MAKKFIRNKEDFTCENCQSLVVGTGYTNHCPKCLWSKHVDINPGDRLEICHGMMKPADAEIAGKEESIIHQCLTCNKTKKNKLSKEDDYGKFILLTNKN